MKTQYQVPCKFDRPANYNKPHKQISSYPHANADIQKSEKLSEVTSPAQWSGQFAVNSQCAFHSDGYIVL